MTTRLVGDTTVEVDDEGFFVRPEQWTEEMAEVLAAEVGVATPLTDRHWQVLRFMRKEHDEKGTGPNVRMLGKGSGVPVKELFQLFPKGPAKLAAFCAGIPKPRGCI